MSKKNQHERKAIHVGDFSAIVWNTFAGIAKMQDLSIRDLLEKVLREWIRKQENA